MASLYCVRRKDEGRSQLQLRLLRGRDRCPSTCRRGWRRSTSKTAPCAATQTLFTSMLTKGKTCECGRKESKIVQLIITSSAGSSTDLDRHKVRQGSRPLDH